MKLKMRLYRTQPHCGSLLTIDQSRLHMLTVSVDPSPKYVKMLMLATLDTDSLYDTQIRLAHLPRHGHTSTVWPKYAEGYRHPEYIHGAGPPL